MLRIRLLVFTVLIGGLLLSACGSAGNGPVNVDVTLKEFTIDSSVTEFKPGVQYHFTIHNEGQIAHEFMLMPTDGNGDMSGMSMEEKDAMALMVVPEEQLPPGATVEVDHTFENAPDGKIEMVCMLPGHYEAGMHIPVSFK